MLQDILFSGKSTNIDKKGGASSKLLIALVTGQAYQIRNLQKQTAFLKLKLAAQSVMLQAVKSKDVTSTPKKRKLEASPVSKETPNVTPATPKSAFAAAPVTPGCHTTGKIKSQTLNSRLDDVDNKMKSATIGQSPHEKMKGVLKSSSNSADQNTSKLSNEELKTPRKQSQSDGQKVGQSTSILHPAGRLHAKVLNATTSSTKTLLRKNIESLLFHGDDVSNIATPKVPVYEDSEESRDYVFKFSNIVKNSKKTPSKEGSVENNSSEIAYEYKTRLHPLTPLGDQAGRAANSMPLSQLSSLQDKMSDWRLKYAKQSSIR